MQREIERRGGSRGYRGRRGESNPYRTLRSWPFFVHCLYIWHPPVWVERQAPVVLCFGRRSLPCSGHIVASLAKCTVILMSRLQTSYEPKIAQCSQTGGCPKVQGRPYPEIHTRPGGALALNRRTSILRCDWPKLL